MENQPKVSIIATFYNSVSLGDFVHKTMRSLLLQTYQNLELIFVNDGSLDNTLSQLEEYQKKDNRIIIVNKKNEGTAQYAKAAGQDVATGEYVMLFDHDDEVSLDAVEKAVKTFQENPSLQMVGFIVKVCFADGKQRAIYNLDEKISSVENFKNKNITVNTVNIINTADVFSEEERIRINKALSEKGNVIAAIKEIRNITGWDLKK